MRFPIRRRRLDSRQVIDLSGGLHLGSPVLAEVRQELAHHRFGACSGRCVVSSGLFLLSCATRGDPSELLLDVRHAETGIVDETAVVAGNWNVAHPAGPNGIGTAAATRPCIAGSFLVSAAQRCSLRP
jgi:hypothetical protein